jgi:hypothetical protein
MSIFSKNREKLRTWKSGPWLDNNSDIILKLLKHRFPNANVHKESEGIFKIGHLRAGENFTILIEFENDADEAEFVFIMA